ncbi:hypothetical protein AB0M12_23765 [Nocardia vinacea]
MSSAARIWKGKPKMLIVTGRIIAAVAVFANATVYGADVCGP